MAIREGDVLDGRFEIQRAVASGGMGVVYRGIDRQTGTLVGIKTLHESAEAERFRREAELLESVRHPGIVAWLAHGRAADALYLVMEWLEGEDLRSRLEGADLGVDESLGVARQVASALAAGHRLGIVHRDVKPSNVFLVDFRLDRLKLLDYGIARRAGQDSLTATGSVVGTPAYMAPEQARGDRTIDARADVYALGAVLFHCIAGRPPFEGASASELLASVLQREPPRLSSVVRVPPAVDALVARLLDREPGRRPRDGAEVLAALDALGTGGPVAQSAAPVRAAVVEPTVVASSRPELSSVAVLSFLDLSAARDQAYLCDGIAEELINTLTQLPGLRVAARSTSFQFKSQAVDARAAGERLGVDAVLEGAVRKAGDRLRVTVQLVDVRDGSPRWSKRFDGTLDDVFAIQDEIATGVATALRGMLSSGEREALRRPETSAEAYAHFLRGRQLFAGNRFLDEAEREYRQALELDPGYAPAWAGLAQLFAWRVEWHGGGADVSARAEEASRKALALGPSLAEAHVAAGMVRAMVRDYRGASLAFEEASRLNPGSYDALYYAGRVAFQEGRHEDSVRLFLRAAEVRHEDFQALMLARMPLDNLGRVEESRALLEEGMRRAERQLELEPANTRALTLGSSALIELGDRERGLEWTRRALAIDPEDPAVLVNSACAFIRLGRNDDALDLLERVFGRGVGKRDWIEHDRDYDPLRGNPRFEALLAKLV